MSRAFAIILCVAGAVLALVLSWSLAWGPDEPVQHTEHDPPTTADGAGSSREADGVRGAPAEPDPPSTIERRDLEPDVERQDEAGVDPVLPAADTDLLNAVSPDLRETLERQRLQEIYLIAARTWKWQAPDPATCNRIALGISSSFQEHQELYLQNLSSELSNEEKNRGTMRLHQQLWRTVRDRLAGAVPAAKLDEALVKMGATKDSWN